MAKFVMNSAYKVLLFNQWTMIGTRAIGHNMTLISNDHSFNHRSNNLD